jgi:hypothetical protein
MSQIDRRLAFPRLAGGDAIRHAASAADRQQQTRHRRRRGRRRARDRFEGEHNQGVSSKDRKRLPKGGMNRRTTATCLGIIEAGQIVMHQRRAVQKLDRDRGAVHNRWIARAARAGDGKT